MLIRLVVAKSPAVALRLPERGLVAKFGAADALPGDPLRLQAGILSQMIAIPFGCVADEQECEQQRRFRNGHIAVFADQAIPGSTFISYTGQQPLERSRYLAAANLLIRNRGLNMKADRGKEYGEVEGILTSAMTRGETPPLDCD
jgi:hypothetical protein